MKKEHLKKILLCLLSSVMIGSYAQNSFEPEVGMVPAPASGASVNNNYYWQNYHVKFLILDPANSSIIGDAKYADIGGPATAFSSNPISNAPPYIGGCNIPANQLANDNPFNSSVDLGCWLITDDNSLTKAHTLRIEYDYPNFQTQYASGFLLDVDGGEGWEVNIYTNNDLVTPEKSIQIIASGWFNQANYNLCNNCNLPGNTCDYDYTKVLNPVPAGGACYNSNNTNNIFYTSTTGNAEATFWDANTNYPINRIEIEYLGDYNQSIGIAFDQLGGLCGANADFSYTQNSNNLSEWHFSDASTTAGGIPIVEKSWTIDGVKYAGNDVSHIFNTSGTYSVCLEITAMDMESGDCCTDVYCEDISVSVPAIACQMDPEILYKCYDGYDCIFQFGALTGGSNRTVKSWYWEFGDGNTSYEQNPIHTYESPGIYEVCLTITGEDGTSCCVNRDCISVYAECNGIQSSSNCASQPKLATPNQDLSGKVDEEADTETTKKSNGFGNITLTPNPNKEKTLLNIEVNSKEEDISIYVYNMMGGIEKIICERKRYEKGKHSIQISSEQMHKGAYLIKVWTTTHQETTRMIVEK